MVAKEEWAVIIVDGSICEIISTMTDKVTERDGTLHTSEAVWYVPEARYNILYIRVLDEERCQIQVQ